MKTTSAQPPGARSSARRSSEIELKATGTDGGKDSRSGPAKRPVPDRQKRQSVASNKNEAKPQKKKQKPRLLVRQRDGSNTGTISSGVKDLDDLCKFLLRVTDNGRRIHLHYEDEDGTRHQPYACHLDPSEWRTLTKRGYRSAVDLIAEKTASRTDGDPAKIRQAVERINLLRGGFDG